MLNVKKAKLPAVTVRFCADPAGTGLGNVSGSSGETCAFGRAADYGVSRAMLLGAGFFLPRCFFTAAGHAWNDAQKENKPYDS